jgi:hypothetical protein
MVTIIEDGKVKDPTSMGLDFVTVTIAIRPRAEAPASGSRPGPEHSIWPALSWQPLSIQLVWR